MISETLPTGERRVTFFSLAELADEAPELSWEPDAYGRSWSNSFGNDRTFTGATPAQAVKLARQGWSDNLPKTLDLVESAVSKVEREDTFPAFVPVFDVAGAEVDVARYLDDEPECMIEYPLTEIVKAGKVITLCASLTVSASVKASSLIRRGQAVAALALALERCGYGCEVWADFSATNDAMHGSDKYSIRTLVKGARDVLDESRLLYALAHPSMLRLFGFGATRALPNADNIRANYGWPSDPTEDLPEGTLYLPSVLTDEDIPDLDSALHGYLRELGILAD